MNVHTSPQQQQQRKIVFQQKLFSANSQAFFYQNFFVFFFCNKEKSCIFGNQRPTLSFSLRLYVHSQIKME